MDDLREYVTSLYRMSKNPVKQVELICELTGQKLGTVLGILRDAKLIPGNVTAKNYQKTLKKTSRKEISEELRRFIIGSSMYAERIARQYQIPLETVLQIRAEAYEKVGGTYRYGGRAVKKSETGRAGHAKDASGDGDRAGKGDRRVRQKRTAGA